MTRRRRLASIALRVLLLMLAGGFCVWTMMRLSRIEARLDRLEILGRRSVNSIVEPPQGADLSTRRRPVCIVPP